MKLKVYQINNDLDVNNVHFIDYDSVVSKVDRIDPSIYKCVFDGKMMTNVVHAQNLNLRYYEEEENSDIVKQLKSTKPKYLTVSRVYAQNIHYAV